MSEIYFDDPNFDHRSWDVISAYGQSKTANIYMANYIDRTYGTQGLHAWSLQPGGIISNLVGKSEEVKQAMISNSEILPWLKTPQQGAATSVWAAIARDLGKSQLLGGLFPLSYCFGFRLCSSIQRLLERSTPKDNRKKYANSKILRNRGQGRKIS
jgi:hypothetical protein